MNWKERGRLFGWAILVAGMVAANAGPTAGPAQALGGDRAAFDLGQAALQAREGIDFLFSDKALAANAAIKITLPLPGGAEAAIWISPGAARNGAFTGIVAPGQPFAAGTKVTFARNQVLDWIVHGQDGRIYGNYTARTLLPSLPPQDRERLAALLSETALPYIRAVHPSGAPFAKG